MDNKKLEELVLSLQYEITTLKAWAGSEIAKRDKIIAELKAENRKLKAEIVELKAKLNVNSGNSGKSSSPDNFKKPAPKSLHEPSGRKNGDLSIFSCAIVIRSSMSVPSLCGIGAIS